MPAAAEAVFRDALFFCAELIYPGAFVILIGTASGAFVRGVSIGAPIKPSEIGMPGPEANSDDSMGRSALFSDSVVGAGFRALVPKLRYAGAWVSSTR